MTYGSSILYQYTQLYFTNAQHCFNTQKFVYLRYSN